MKKWIGALGTADERTIFAVPMIIGVLLLVALSLQVLLSAVHPRQLPKANDLSRPLSPRMARVISLGEPLAYAKVMNLYLQALDNPPGSTIPFRALDYAVLIQWLNHILDLDPHGQYPLLAATRLYASVPDEVRQRLMLDFVYRRFLDAPNARWQWMAHATYVARHQLHDMSLAARYAQAIRLHANGVNVPSWARQMEIFLRADMNEKETAKLLLGGLLASGQVQDPAEYRFLAGRLAELDSAPTSKPVN